jgi:hypothetical protein
MAALSGMKEICKYMSGRSECTMLSIIRDLDFPAKKIHGVWESDTDLADKWRLEQIAGSISTPSSSKKSATSKTLSTINNPI